MKLVETITIKRNHKWFSVLDNLCFLSKNLYNATLYAVRQEFILNKKYLNYNDVNKQFTDTNQVDYRALPAKVAKLTQQLVDKNFKSFFALLKLKNKGEYQEKVKIPKYLHKTKGRQVVTYTSQALKRSKKGFIGLSGTDIYIKTEKEIKFVRLVPKNGFINMELGYEKECIPYTKGLVAGLDIGVNNLAAVVIPNKKALLVNGKPLKSINQFYNKKLAKEKSYLSRFKTEDGKERKKSAKIQRIHNKRNAKIKDYMHKVSRIITNHLVSNGVSDFVIGLNQEWKQDVKMCKASKQTFIQIPFKMFIDMLTYKCELVGIHVILQEESYTSKNSFFDEDYIATYGVDDDLNKSSGKRVKRGLYQTSKGKLINADVNGALNILRKAVQNEQVAKNRVETLDFVEVCSTPVTSVIN